MGGGRRRAKKCFTAGPDPALDGPDVVVKIIIQNFWAFRYVHVCFTIKQGWSRSWVGGSVNETFQENIFAYQWSLFYCSN